MEGRKMNGEMIGSSLLEAQAHVWKHIFKFIDSLSLKCAVELGIFDIIHSHGQPMSLSDLVSALHVRPNKAQCLGRLMRLLAHSGFFASAEEDGSELGEEVKYILTPPSRLLLQNEPQSAAPLLVLMLDQAVLSPWDFLSSWFKSDDHVTAFEMGNNGRAIWDYIAGETKFGDLFHRTMLCDSSLVGGVVVRECGGVFEGLKSLVDVGGGSGTMAKAVAAAFPCIECTVFDLPLVIHGLQPTENLRFVGGDMFQGIPKADAVLLKWVLHDWNDEDSIKILKNCRDAIPSKAEGGKLIVIDLIFGSREGDKEITEVQLWFDMVMMVNTTGKERDLKEWESLFLAAGFTSFKIIYEMGARSLIEVYP